MGISIKHGQREAEMTVEKQARAPPSGRVVFSEAPEDLA